MNAYVLQCEDLVDWTTLSAVVNRQSSLALACCFAAALLVLQQPAFDPNALRNHFLHVLFRLAGLAFTFSLGVLLQLLVS